VAGTKLPGFDANHTVATLSRLNNPQAVCVRRGSGVLYIADTGNFRVVCVDPTTKRLSVVMGVSGVAAARRSARSMWARLRRTHPLVTPARRG
jgi:hypothetical protein